MTVHVAYTDVETPAGTIWLAATPAGLVRLQFGGGADTLLMYLPSEGEPERNDAVLQRYVRRLGAYFEDPHAGLALPIDWDRLKLSSFQRQVLRQVLEIPVGQTTTYQQITTAVGRPHGAQAVGRAVAVNPILLVIPCHRILGRDGSIRNYAGGREVKVFLLRHEGALLL